MRPPLNPTPEEDTFLKLFGLKNNHGLRKQQCINISALTYLNELFILRIGKERIVLVRYANCRGG